MVVVSPKLFVKGDVVCEGAETETGEKERAIGEVSSFFAV